MVLYSKLSSEQLRAKFEETKQIYEEFKAKGLDLNMARGKPSPTQLDMSMDIFDSVNALNGYSAEDGTDCRNYGVLDGIAEAKKHMAWYIDSVRGAAQARAKIMTSSCYADVERVFDEIIRSGREE